MIDKHLAETESNWRIKITELEALLDEVRPQLIEAETNLADRLAVISAFEFTLRARLEPLTRQLEKLIAEIQGFRKQLRKLQKDFDVSNDDDDWNDLKAWDFDKETAAANDDYRYRGSSPETPPPSLSKEETTTLKQLYRQLARRFHPDLALNNADRAYRTDIMKAINAAYSAGDHARLQELAKEPDSANRIEFAHTDEQLAQALYLELNRCRRRLVEIQEELSRLEQHKSARLLRQSERAASKGRDMVAEIVTDIQNEIAHKMIERDVFKQQIENFKREEPKIDNNLTNDDSASDIIGSDDFADAILDLGFEGVFDEDPLTSSGSWEKQRWSDDDILDDRE